MLVTDILPAILMYDVAKIIGIDDHSQASSQHAAKIEKIANCYLYRKNKRVVFPAVVFYKVSEAFWTFFLCDTGAPKAYLSCQVNDATEG